MNSNNIPITKGRRFLSLVVTLCLSGTMLSLFAISGAGQEVLCTDARAKQARFAKLSGRSLGNACTDRRRNIKLGTEGTMVEVMISGHVTHQNGVRMSGVIMSLRDTDTNTTRTVVTDEMGNYLFANIPWGSGVELTPSLTNYEFFPPAVIWEGIVEDEVWNFIAVGPPPPPPPPPANQPTLAWSSYFDNSPQMADYNGMIGRDGQGNIYAGGTSYTENDSAGNTDIVLFKTDGNGNRVWSRTFDGAGHYKDALRDMTVDAAGNTYLAGYSYSADTGNPALRSYDYVVLKYNTSGDLLWTKYYGGNPGYDDFAQSLKVDNAGNAYVAGYSWGIGTYANYATVKFDSNGNQLWAKRFAGGNGEILNEVEVDSGGNVYVTGYSNNSSAGGSEDIVTIKYNAAGDQMWLDRYDSATHDSDEGYELEINAAGDVFVLGESYDFSTSKILVRKINGSTGAAVWTKEVNVTGGNGGAVPVGMELDQNGSLILTGMIYDEVSYNVDTFVAKLDAEAVIQWSRTYDGPSDENYDGDPKMTFDSSGNIYLAVTSEGFANADIQVIKYLPNGDQDWTYRFGNPFFTDDYMLDWRADGSQKTILLDVQGNLYLSGESYIPNQSADLLVFKLEPVAQTRAVPFDFDGDRKADIAVFRPETGVWFILKSSDGTYTGTGWGIATDKLVPADYDGDGKNDIAIYRDGQWWITNSSTGALRVGQFGAAGDSPVPTDFDNDGKADLSVYRGGVWHSLASSNNAYSATQFGLPDDIPVPSDFDSNRRSDVAVYRNGVWFVRYQNELPLSAIQFGIQTDKVVPADYDGDKKTDHAVFRDGVWYIWQSASGSLRALQFGLAGDIPVPADYDGDKKADIAVYRQGIWHILRSSDNGYTAIQFGTATDIPIPSVYSKPIGQ